VSSLQEEFDKPLVGCSLCHRAIKTEQNEPVYEEHVGWQRKRKTGGTNVLYGRHTTGRFACMRCIEKIRKSIHPDQLTLS